MDDNKIIFLDIDGPMIPIRAYWLSNQTVVASVFDPVAVSLLNKLIEDSKARVVISSTWRRQGYDAIVALLKENDIDPQHLHEDWATPEKFTSHRIHEIKWWLDEHPEVTHYVAIDDEDLEISFVPNAVKADTYEGLSLCNYLEARMFLDLYTEDQQDQKSEHQDLIFFLKTAIIQNLKRSGEKDRWKVREMLDILFENDEEETDANS